MEEESGTRNAIRRGMSHNIVLKSKSMEWEMLQEFERERQEMLIMSRSPIERVRERGRERIAVIEESVRQLKRIMGPNRDKPMITGGYDVAEMNRIGMQELMKKM